MIIVESQYWGCVNYYYDLLHAEHCMIDKHEHFTKMSFRNRCMIVGSNGVINLSIPVEGGRNNRSAMKDVKICYSENWQNQHWKAIKSSYSKAPFFEYYGFDVERLIMKSHQFLFYKNMEILLFTKNILKLKTGINISENNIAYNEDNKFDLRNKWLPKNNQDKPLNSIRYNQVFEEKLGFQANMSILDFIFCAGRF